MEIEKYIRILYLVQPLAVIYKIIFLTYKRPLNDFNCFAN